ncbi:uncharacterized protein FIBRA_00133 [Fibroporia radiculosa]|uniref:Uncharacterized protein n=1 Tax=Fibroporia radiculosa TaxID=599839 RepID=J7S5P5_9APHY|nr:uncharacterized protein FIBRA_00133 [Fibroporia radiculosa]CCL98139.1 predicted protein [Fibroporia radiculosa]
MTTTTYDVTILRYLTKCTICTAAFVLCPVFFVLNIVLYGIQVLYRRLRHGKATPRSHVLIRERGSSPRLRTHIRKEPSIKILQTKSEPTTPAEHQTSPRVSFSENTYGDHKPAGKKRWPSPAKLFSSDNSVFNARSVLASTATTPTLCSTSSRFFSDLPHLGSAQSMNKAEVGTTRKDYVFPPSRSSLSILPRRRSSFNLKLPSTLQTVPMFKPKSQRTQGGPTRSASDPTAWTALLHGNRPSVHLPAMLRRKTDIPSTPSARRNSADSALLKACRSLTNPGISRRRAASVSETVHRVPVRPCEPLIPSRRPTAPACSDKSATVQKSLCAARKESCKADIGEPTPPTRRSSAPPMRPMPPESSGTSPHAARGRLATDPIANRPRPPLATQETFTTKFVNPFNFSSQKSRTTSALYEPATPKTLASPTKASTKRRSLSKFFRIEFTPKARLPSPILSRTTSKVSKSTLNVSTPAPPCSTPRTQPYGYPYYAQMPGQTGYVTPIQPQPTHFRKDTSGFVPKAGNGSKDAQLTRARGLQNQRTTTIAEARWTNTLGLSLHDTNQRRKENTNDGR